MNKNFFFIITIFFISLGTNQSSSMDDQESYYGALNLETPFIRVPLKKYLQTTKHPKLILGEGHIDSGEILVEDFRPDGAQALTESMIDFEETPYSFHQNIGYYTASAELGKNFNSDWCGNLTNPTHRQTLFPLDSYFFIFDATYHPGAICEGLFSDVVESLRFGGAFIMQLPIKEKNGSFMCGHDTSEHSMPWYSRKLTFEKLEDVYTHWEKFLISKGFARIDFYKSPITLWLETKKTCLNWFSTEYKVGEEINIEEFHQQFKQEIPTYSIKSAVARIDPHLGHYGLSTHYLIAWKN